MSLGNGVPMTFTTARAAHGAESSRTRTKGRLRRNDVIGVASSAESALLGAITIEKCGRDSTRRGAVSNDGPRRRAGARRRAANLAAARRARATVLPPGARSEQLRAQYEELVERVLDRQLLHVREAGLPGEGAHAALADDGPEPLAPVRERHGHAVQRAEALERLADGMTVLERVVGGVRLRPEEHAVVGETGPDRAQRALRIHHVMDAVERAHEPEPPVARQLVRGLGAPLDVEQPALGGRAAGTEDGARVVVDAEEARGGEGGGHRHRRQPVAAADVGHLDPRLEPLGKTGHGRQPLLHEEVDVAGAEEARDALWHLGPDLRVGNAAAVAEDAYQLLGV